MRRPTMITAAPAISASRSRLLLRPAGGLLLLASTIFGPLAFSSCQGQERTLQDGPLPDRPQLVRQRIAAWNEILQPRDRQVKFAKMRESAFLFFRGTNHLYWQDMAGKPSASGFSSERTRTWILGDLHVENFGAWQNQRGQIVYDFDDFDDALIADYQFDLWRLAISVVLIARQNGDLNLDRQKQVVGELARGYLEALEAFDGNDDEVDFCVTSDNAYGRLDEFLDGVSRDNSRQEMLQNWTVATVPNRLDLTKQRLEAVPVPLRAQIEQGMAGYARRLTRTASESHRTPTDRPDHFFAVKDVARRLFAGTGSLGTDRFYVLIEGNTRSAEDDRILDVKQQVKPAGFGSLTDDLRQRFQQVFGHEGQRQAVAFRALTSNEDPLLGWTSIEEGEFSVRERSPYKEKFDLPSLNSLTRMTKLVRQWATITAAHHARADRDFDPRAIPYSFEHEVILLLGDRREQFVSGVIELAVGYAGQVEADYRQWRRQDI